MWYPSGSQAGMGSGRVGGRWVPASCPYWFSTDLEESNDQCPAQICIVLHTDLFHISVLKQSQGLGKVWLSSLNRDVALNCCPWRKDIFAVIVIVTVFLLSDRNQISVKPINRSFSKHVGNTACIRTIWVLKADTQSQPRTAEPQSMGPT